MDDNCLAIAVRLSDVTESEQPDPLYVRTEDLTTWRHFELMLKNMYKSPPQCIRVCYLDDEKDWIEFGSDSELAEAVAIARSTDDILEIQVKRLDPDLLMYFESTLDEQRKSSQHDLPSTLNAETLVIHPLVYPHPTSPKDAQAAAPTEPLHLTYPHPEPEEPSGSSVLVIGATGTSASMENRPDVPVDEKVKFLKEEVARREDAKKQDRKMTLSSMSNHHWDEASAMDPADKVKFLKKLAMGISQTDDAPKAQEKTEESKEEEKTDCPEQVNPSKAVENPDPFELNNAQPALSNTEQLMQINCGKNILTPQKVHYKSDSQVVTLQPSASEPSPGSDKKSQPAATSQLMPQLVKLSAKGPALVPPVPMPRNLQMMDGAPSGANAVAIDIPETDLYHGRVPSKEEDGTASGGASCTSASAETGEIMTGGSHDAASMGRETKHIAVAMASCVGTAKSRSTEKSQGKGDREKKTESATNPKGKPELSLEKKRSVDSMGCKEVCVKRKPPAEKTLRQSSRTDSEKKKGTVLADVESGEKAAVETKTDDVLRQGEFVKYMRKWRKDLHVAVVKDTCKQTEKLLKQTLVAPDRPDRFKDPRCAGAHHKGIYCDLCNKVIFGIRFKCGNCRDFDLCETCESSQHNHNPTHVFLKIQKPARKAGRVGKEKFPLLRENIYEMAKKEPVKVLLEGVSEKLRQSVPMVRLSPARTHLVESAQFLPKPEGGQDGGAVKLVYPSTGNQVVPESMVVGAERQPAAMASPSSPVDRVDQLNGMDVVRNVQGAMPAAPVCADQLPDVCQEMSKMHLQQDGSEEVPDVSSPRVIKALTLFAATQITKPVEQEVLPPPTPTSAQVTVMEVSNQVEQESQSSPQAANVQEEAVLEIERPVEVVTEEQRDEPKSVQSDVAQTEEEESEEASGSSHVLLDIPSDNASDVDRDEQEDDNGSGSDTSDDFCVIDPQCLKDYDNFLSATFLSDEFGTVLMEDCCPIDLIPEATPKVEHQVSPQASDTCESEQEILFPETDSDDFQDVEAEEAEQEESDTSAIAITSLAENAAENVAENAAETEAVGNKEVEETMQMEEVREVEVAATAGTEEIVKIEVKEEVAGVSQNVTNIEVQGSGEVGCGDGVTSNMSPEQKKVFVRLLSTEMDAEMVELLAQRARELEGRLRMEKEQEVQKILEEKEKEAQMANAELEEARKRELAEKELKRAQRRMEQEKQRRLEEERRLQQEKQRRLAPNAGLACLLDAETTPKTDLLSQGQVVEKVAVAGGGAARGSQNVRPTEPVVVQPAQSRDADSQCVSDPAAQATQVLQQVATEVSKVASSAFLTAKDVFYSLQAKGEKKPAAAPASGFKVPKSTWEPKPDTWKPTSSTWTLPKDDYVPPQSNWNPPKSNWTPPKSDWTPKQSVGSPTDQPRQIEQRQQPSAPAMNKPAASEQTTTPALSAHSRSSSISSGPSSLSGIPLDLADSQLRRELQGMQRLIEMGFANRDKNRQLLNQFDGDLEKVVQSLLQEEGENHWSWGRY